MEQKSILKAFEEACPNQAFEAHAIPVDETIIDVPAACLATLVAVLRDRFSVHHLSTITGQDRGTTIELLYHFWGEQGITLRLTLPRDDTRVVTLTDAIPGADFYEREVAEMLGVTFEGHPGPEHLLLPEDWAGGAPLRRDPPAEEEDA